jgi:hypothetical protein
MTEAADAVKFRTLKIITLAMMAGATLFLLVCGVIIFTATEKTPASEEGGMMPFLALVAATWVASQMIKLQIETLFGKKLAGADPFNAYQSLLIMKMISKTASGLRKKIRGYGDRLVVQTNWGF